jgi:hypothetical protein
MGEPVPADTVRVLVAIVNAAREASERPPNVPVFKDPLKLDLRDRVGVASTSGSPSFSTDTTRATSLHGCELGYFAVALL